MLTLYSWKERKKGKSYNIVVQNVTFCNSSNIYIYVLYQYYHHLLLSLNISSWYSIDCLKVMLKSSYFPSKILVELYYSYNHNNRFFFSLSIIQTQFRNNVMIILDPYRKFNIFVKAYNTKNEGNASQDIQVHKF